MTADKLHDAITLLPSDLVAATDRLRTAPRTKVIQWKRWAAMAACLVLLLSTGLVFRRIILPGMGGRKEAAAEAPMAMAPQITADGAVPEMFVEEAAPEAPAEIGSGIAEVPAAENAAADSSNKSAEADKQAADHRHGFAEETETDSAAGYCGNMVTTILAEGEEHILSGTDSVVITDILANLDYDPDATCRCMAEFTVDTELLAGIEVNLTQSFARCDRGQAALTEAQVQIIREIVNILQ